MHGKSNEQIKMMLERAGTPWEDISLYNQRGLEWSIGKLTETAR